MLHQNRTAVILLNNIDKSNGKLSRKPEVIFMERSEELEALCKPIVEFLNKNCCPYDHIVISSASIKIVNETESIPVMTS